MFTKCSFFLCLLWFQVSCFSLNAKDIPRIPEFGMEEFTFSAWIKTEDGGPIFSKAVPKNKRLQRIKYPDGKRVPAEEYSRGTKYMDAGDCLSYYNEGAGDIEEEIEMNDGQWHHIVLTSKLRIKIYVDGKHVLTKNMERREDPISSSFFLGYYTGEHDDNGRYFSGMMDDVRVFNRALSDKEISKLSKEEKPSGKMRGMVAYWPLDRNGADLSGNDLNAKTNGSIAFSEGKYGKALELEGEGCLAVECMDIPLFLAAEGALNRKYHGSDQLKEYKSFAKHKKLLFVKRHTYKSNHFYTDHINGSSEYGGNICVLDLSTGKVTDLIPSMKDGIFGRYNLHFSAKKIVFDWRKKENEGYRIYEIDIDPEKGVAVGLPRQLTFIPDDEELRISKYRRHTDDMHPCYLPDGGICFVSTRCEYRTLCDRADGLNTSVMYRMDSDGKNMEKLSDSAVNEFSPSIMNDGRILYTRWEYVDKGQNGPKCLWAMRPDGSGSSEIYGNDISYPPSFLHGIQIPGQSQKYIVLGTPHYPQGGMGTVIKLDTSKNIRTREPMTYLTPFVDIRQEPGWNHYVNGEWVMHENGPLYQDPYPLSENLFMLSHNPDKRWSEMNAYGIYLLDCSGNHTLVYKNDDISCWQPVPLTPRNVPPVLLSACNPELARKNLAECIVQDIYFGMEHVKRGTIKYIRIMEQRPRSYAARRRWKGDKYGYAHAAIGELDGPLSPKVMHGVVPVYEDGSAHFYVPADRNIYFQALDKNYMEVQRERTYINYRPGEARSCIGCHETPNQSPPMLKKPPVASKEPADMPGPQPGDKTAGQVIHYPTYIQPILDKHCISCHKGKDAPEELDLSAKDTKLFSTAYEDIISRDLIINFGENTPFRGIEYVPPYTVGSHASKFMQIILKGCPGQKTKLPLSDIAKFATWIDAGAPYYGSYWGRRNIMHKEHPNYRIVPTFEQAISNESPLPWEER